MWIAAPKTLVQNHQGLAHSLYDCLGEVETALGGIDIDQHHYGAIGLAVRTGGGEHSERVPSAVRVADIARCPIAAIHGIQQQPPQVRELHLRLKIGDRPPDIGGDQVQHGFDGAREAPNPQIPAYHHEWNANALQ
ncbi:MAG: hypothetical protein WDO73_31765 [Ignavibacteriota bacterium]